MSKPKPELPFSELVSLTQQAVEQSDVQLSWTFPSMDCRQHCQPSNQLPNQQAVLEDRASRALISYEVFLFLLIWLQKKNYLERYMPSSSLSSSPSNSLPPEESEHSIDCTAVNRRAHVIFQNLAEWGEMIQNLQDGDPVEWELLRLQMEKAVRRYAPEFDDALQDALLKVHDIITRLPEHGALTKYLSLDEFLQIDERFRSIYDYGSPFYAYAKVVARNELIGQLRKLQRRPVYDLPIEEIHGAGVHGASALTYVAPENTVSIEEREQAVIEQLGVDMTSLMEIIHSLSPKQQQTILPTLATREQFWRAADLVGLSLSGEFAKYKEMNSDSELSNALGMTENNLRVHRQHGKKRIQAKEPMLAELFERLIAKHD